MNRIKFRKWIAKRKCIAKELINIHFFWKGKSVIPRKDKIMFLLDSIKSFFLHYPKKIWTKFSLDVLRRCPRCLKKVAWNMERPSNDEYYFTPYKDYFHIDDKGEIHHDTSCDWPS